MTTQVHSLVVKPMGNPDETRTPPKAHVEVCKIGDHTVMRATFEPGWKWSECIKPVAKTDHCMVEHFVYTISGRMVVVMEDGTKKEFGPGDAGHIPPGHDAWIVGTEKCVMIDFSGGGNYAKK
ncbi:MAG TPA: cupin domain-containing protein [Candidatus Xenobia bacterium]|jgi:mannose-6-phosphate isomerase-like protein (cupin superfamily)